MATIDMQAMRYINLLDKVSRVKTRRCFMYNNQLFFAVEKSKVSKAIGAAAGNIRKMQETLGKKVRIVGEPESVEEIRRFIEDVVAPTQMKSIEVKDGCAIITAGSNQNKASLIGRERRRYEELKKIINDFFNLDLKII